MRTVLLVGLLLFPGILRAQEDAFQILGNIRNSMDKLENQLVSYKIVQSVAGNPLGNMVVSDSGRFYIGKERLYRKSASGEVIIGDGYQVIINHHQKIVHVSNAGSLRPEEIDPMENFRNIFTYASELRIKSRDASTGEIFIKSKVFASGEYSLVYQKKTFLIESIQIYPDVPELASLLPLPRNNQPQLIISFGYLPREEYKAVPRPADVFSKEKNKLVLKSTYHGYQLYATAK